MAEHGVPVQTERPREHDHVLRHPLEGPRLFGRGPGPALCPLIDQKQPEPVGERVEVIGELVMVQARTAVQHDDRRTGTALLDEQAGVVDSNQLAPRTHPGGAPHASRPTIRNAASRSR